MKNLNRMLTMIVPTLLLSSQIVSASSSDTGTLTAGEYDTCFMGALDHTILFGYSSGFAGSYSPTELTGGKTVADLYDHESVGHGICVFPKGSSFTVSGFSADPGATWLSSVTCNGVTNSESASTYIYSSGSASWQWTQTFGIGGGTYSCTIVHN